MGSVKEFIKMATQLGSLPAHNAQTSNRINEILGGARAVPPATPQMQQAPAPSPNTNQPGFWDMMKQVYKKHNV